MLKDNKMGGRNGGKLGGTCNRDLLAAASFNWRRHPDNAAAPAPSSQLPSPSWVSKVPVVGAPFQ